MVALDSTRVDYSAFASGAADLRFFDPDGTQLEYEIERWDPSARSIIWVRVPQIDAASSTDFMWMQFGDPSATDMSSPAKVWTGDYVGVWHLATDPGPGAPDDIRDSTARAHHGTASAAMTSTQLGAAHTGLGIHFEGTDERVLMPASPDFTLPTYTWTLWLCADAAPSASVGNRDAISNGDVGFNFAWDHNTLTYRGAAAQRDINVWHSAIASTGFTGGVWYAIGATYDGVQLCSYLNGVQSMCVPSLAPEPPNGSLSIGGPNVGAGTFTGWIDEVRVSSISRSTTRITADYASEADTLVTYGVAEPLP
jgi:hypothetical protein